MSSLVQKFAPQIVCWGITSLLCQAAFPLSKLLWIVQSGQKTVPVWKLFHKYPKWANCYQYKLTDLCQNELGTEATNGYRRDAGWQWQFLSLHISSKDCTSSMFQKGILFPYWDDSSNVSRNRSQDQGPALEGIFACAIGSLCHPRQVTGALHTLLHQRMWHDSNVGTQYDNCSCYT